MQGISLQNWMVMVNDTSNVNIGFYDEDMAEMAKIEAGSARDTTS